MTTQLLDVRRSDERFKTKTGWLNSAHSFSFGHHQDPNNTHHGLLLVNNDDIITAGEGFDMHPHRNMEIVTWVLAGALAHQDSEGNMGVIYPNLAQRMSAGTGIWHSERNDAWVLTGEVAHTNDTHLVQMWVKPDRAEGTPGYQQQEIAENHLQGQLYPVASGSEKDAAVYIQNPAATFWVGRYHNQSVQLPKAPWLHIYIAKGTAHLDDITLETGDAVRLTNSDVNSMQAGANTEVLVWEMHKTL